MSYSEEILKHKAEYPFDKWRTYFYGDEDDEEEDSGMEQYTPENCDKAQQIMDDLLSGLIQLGEKAPQSAKVELFRTAVESLNELNDETDGSIIETGEREELCELFDNISLSAGLNPKDYGGGEGIASEWRDW
jgi:hypothetical protein